MAESNTEPTIIFIMTISLDLTLIGATAVVKCECCEITQQCTYIKDHDTRWSEGYPNGLRPVAVAVCEGCKSHEFSCVPEEEADCKAQQEQEQEADDDFFDYEWPLIR